MNTDSELSDELRLLERRWERLTDRPESPRSLMNIIEYSLGEKRKAEVYVNRLLNYFLDPEESHGMDTEFLRAFLNGLPTEVEFQEDVYDLSNVRVDQQVLITAGPSDEATSSRYPDLVIQAPNEWFLLIELKFAAQDTQTEFYYQEATHIADRPKTAYDSGQYYLYLHRHDKPAANEPQFSNWTWRDFTANVLQPFITENAPRYPQRTTARLHELHDDITDITGMTEQNETTQKKIELYLDHYEAITDVTSTFDERWNTFTGEWGRLLGEALEQDGYGRHASFDEDLTTINLETVSETHATWKFRSSSDDWGMIFQDGWWRHTDDLTGEIYARPDDRNDVRIGFHHRLGRNRELAIGDRTLKFYFRNMGANDQTFIDAFTDIFAERRAEIDQALPTATSITGNKRDMLIATYDIQLEEHEDFFDAYIGALQQAFVDHVAENERLLTHLTEVYQDSLEDVYSVSPRQN